MKNLKELIQEKLKVSKNKYIPSIEEFIEAFAKPQFLTAEDTDDDFTLHVCKLPEYKGKRNIDLIRNGERLEIHNINKDTTNVILPVRGKIFLNSIRLTTYDQNELYISFFREEYGTNISQVKLKDNKYLIDILGEDLYLDFFEILNT